MKAVLIGHATLPPPKEYFVRSVKESDILIAADGGAAFCHECDLQPHIIIGDLDSIDPKVLKLYEEKSEILKFPKDKDETDIELAYNEAIKRGASSLKVFSWADERIDYSLGALLSLSESPVPTEFSLSNHSVYLLNKNQPTYELNSDKGESVSIFPLVTPVSLKSTGLKWELDWENVDQRTHSQSNEFIEQASITLTEGTAFVLKKRL